MGVHSACFEVLNLYAGVSQSDSGFEEICREPSEGFIASARTVSYSGPMYEGSLHISLYPDSDRETPAHRFSTSKHAERTPDMSLGLHLIGSSGSRGSLT